MSDRDAWVHFYCALLNKVTICTDTAQRAADNALEALRERDEQKLFDRAEGGYRDAPEIK